MTLLLTMVYCISEFSATSRKCTIHFLQSLRRDDSFFSPYISHDAKDSFHKNFRYRNTTDTAAQLSTNSVLLLF